MNKAQFLQPGDTISVNGMGRWRVVEIADGFITMERVIHKGATKGDTEVWKIREDHEFISAPTPHKYEPVFIDGEWRVGMRRGKLHLYDFHFDNRPECQHKCDELNNLA